MKNQTLWLTSLLLAVSFIFLTAANPPPVVDYTTAGYQIGHRASDKIGFNGATPTAQRSGSAQAAITDSTTGTAGTTAAAGVGVTTISIPIELASLANGNVNPTAYTLGYKFKILSATFAVNKAATTGSKLSTLTMKIGSTSITGFSIALTSANCTPTGALVASSSITAANTGTATDTITLVAGSTTAFVEGNGELLLKVQNMDTADTAASILNLENEIRASLVAKGLMKGS